MYVVRNTTTRQHEGNVSSGPYSDCHFYASYLLLFLASNEREGERDRRLFLFGRCPCCDCPGVLFQYEKFGILGFRLGVWQLAAAAAAATDDGGNNSSLDWILVVPIDGSEFFHPRRRYYRCRHRYDYGHVHVHGRCHVHDRTESQSESQSRCRDCCYCCCCFPKWGDD